MSLVRILEIEIDLRGKSYIGCIHCTAMDLNNGSKMLESGSMYCSIARIDQGVYSQLSGA